MYYEKPRLDPRAQTFGNLLALSFARLGAKFLGKHHDYRASRALTRTGRLLRHAISSSAKIRVLAPSFRA